MEGIGLQYGVGVGGGAQLGPTIIWSRWDISNLASPSARTEFKDLLEMRAALCVVGTTLL